MTERLHFPFSLSCIGEGNGNPLQYSCLENPRDRGSWWAALYGVAQSRTRLEWLSLARSIRHKSQDPSTFQGRTVITLSITSQAIYHKGGMIFIYFMWEFRKHYSSGLGSKMSREMSSFHLLSRVLVHVHVKQNWSIGVVLWTNRRINEKVKLGLHFW